MECGLKFKTFKQKMMHHNKVDTECKKEKESLIKLISHLKQSILSYKNLNNNLEFDDDYLKLREQYEKSQKHIIDTIYFNSVVGEDFNECFGIFKK